MTKFNSKDNKKDKNNKNGKLDTLEKIDKQSKVSKTNNIKDKKSNKFISKCKKNINNFCKSTCKKLNNLNCSHNFFEFSNSNQNNSNQSNNINNYSNNCSIGNICKKKRKQKIPLAVKQNVWVTNFGEVYKHKCYVDWCHRVMTVFEFEVGHNIPESKGGTLDLNNLRPICHQCNIGMGNQYTIDEWSDQKFLDK